LVKRFLLLLAFGILATSALAFGAKNAARNPDTELAGRVRGALHASFGTVAEEIGVTAQNGFVFLYGEVSESVRARAARIAAGVPGVRAVNNELQVSSGS
jgi:osmotically-inducible protein OsmY